MATFKKGSNAFFLTALLLAVMLGYLLGWIVTAMSFPSRVPMLEVPDTRGTVPVVRIDGVVNGKLQGSVSGAVHVFLLQKQIVPDAQGLFRISAAPLLTNQVLVAVPEGMEFVASKRGEKYYAVDSSQGSKITPENRIYFRTAEEAERAGYRK